jgi:uncharacterized membrane protein YeaQ/YmgE (transglycosylase-associated protein family)
MPLTWILLVLLGTLLGWLGSVVFHGRTAGEVLAFVLSGVAGGLLGALFITPTFAGKLEPTGFTLPGLLFSLAGSVLLVALTAAVLRVKRRRPDAG